MFLNLADLFTRKLSKNEDSINQKCFSLMQEKTLTKMEPLIR